MHTRMRHMIVLASAIASLTALSVGPASAAVPKSVDIVGDQDLGAAQGVPFYFKQGRITVHQGETVTWRNHTPEPHTVSIINHNEVPQTLAQTEACAFCDELTTAHVPSMGPQGPQPPFVAALSTARASNASPSRLDGRGDSILVAGQGQEFPSTSGGLIPDTTSAVVTAPAGTTLDYLCLVHPWMQGQIQVLRRGEH